MVKCFCVGLMILFAVAGATCAAPPTTQELTAEEQALPATGKIFKILPIGDSITQGSTAETCYRFPLWLKLHAAGYFAEYVGGRESATRIGAIKHEGWSGHTAEFFAKNIEEFYKKDPADIVLLHSGHNHTVEEKPIPSIIESHEKIITTIRSANPQAIIFVAQVITSGKLPKYSYIPELNAELEKLVLRLDPQQAHVKIVNQADGWDYKTDCVADMVHPNSAGAQKMAQKWFDALVQVLPSPGKLLEPKLVAYKKVPNRQLQLHVFDGQAGGKNRPAIVYFFGGGWSLGTPVQFYAECRELAGKGMVAISADYRIGSLDKSNPFQSLADAKSALRWIRAHADELGIDPHAIVAAGSSAGGHLAAACAICPGCDDPADDANISCKPDALVLLAPVLNNGPDGFGYESVKDHYREFSPYHALMQKAPPTKIFMGERDKSTSPVIREFVSHMQQLGGRCELHLFPGLAHGLFSYRAPPSEECLTIRKETIQFLSSLGYIKE